MNITTTTNNNNNSPLTSEAVKTSLQTSQHYFEKLMRLESIYFICPASLSYSTPICMALLALAEIPFGLCNESWVFVFSCEIGQQRTVTLVPENQGRPGREKQYRALRSPISWITPPTFSLNPSTTRAFTTIPLGHEALWRDLRGNFPASS